MYGIEDAQFESSLKINLLAHHYLSQKWDFVSYVDSDSDGIFDDSDCDPLYDNGVIADCNGVCGGGAVVDCAGVCGGSSLEDECGVCDGPGIAEGRIVTRPVSTMDLAATFLDFGREIGRAHV